MLKSMRQQRVPAGKLACLPNPVHFPEPGKSDGRIVYGGRLAVEKSPDMLLDLAEALPETQITVAGDGPERDYLASRAGFNVEFTGHLSRPNMDKLYASSSVVVITSCCMENSPAVMLEAMAAGVCVVAPDQPSLREWIQDGRTGRLYSTGDTADMIRVVNEVLAAGADSAAMGSSARNLVLNRHAPERIADGLEYFYQLAAQKARMRRILQ
jgi:glycosyltransferase involved in cell wall biosynthesis